MKGDCLTYSTLFVPLHFRFSSDEIETASSGVRLRSGRGYGGTLRPQVSWGRFALDLALEFQTCVLSELYLGIM